MILKTCFLLVLSVAWEVLGASYSNVYVQTGPEAAPAVEYIQYGAPPYSYEYGSPLRAQYNAAPVGYEYPFGQSYSYRTACPSGACVYPEQTIATIAPAAPSPNILTYTAPAANLPYAYGRNEPASSYSYVLVNQGAGPELKLSDGEVIRGGYSFLQPEGLVQYVADDNQGLNAIFKNYILNEAVAQPETTHHETVHHETVHHELVHHAEPCHEAKSEALTALASHDGGQEEHHGHAHHESEEHEEEHNAPHEGHEARHGSHEEPVVHEFIVHGSHSESDSHESGGHTHEDRIIIIEEKEHHEVESENTEHGHHDTEHVGHDHHEIEHENHETDHESHETHEEEHEKPTHDSHTHEAIVEVSSEPHENHNHEGHVATQVPAQLGNNVYISYNDFIKCIQAAMARGNTHPYYTPVPKPTSPLTYLIFNKPC